jgi:CRISPR-associated endonuclease/helicase Cas3
MIEPLWAKSRKPNETDRPSLRLPVHLADVHRAAARVLTATGDDQLRAVGLPPEEYRERFHRVVLLAAAAHDLGKANDHFQGMLAGTRQRQPQGLRHEWVSVLMLADEGLRDWLRTAVGASELDWHAVQWAVSGHHPAYGRPSPPRLAIDGAGRQMSFLYDHPDFGRCLRWLGEAFGLNQAIPRLVRREVALVGPGNAFAVLAEWHRRAHAIWSATGPGDRRFVAAVKSCLIGADVAGSALPCDVRDEAERDAWIGRAFANTPPPGRLRRIVDRRRDNLPLRPFQEEVGASDAPVTFVRAGCGSGKTLAAYHWAASCHPTRRLYFCYPTTGTATEGYRDYLHAPEEEFDTELFHGRAAVDLDIILGVREDDDHGDGLARIESLDAWSTPIVSCTVDTVLGLVQNNRRGLYAWPALAGAAFVFDEVHAYDDRLFGALLRFFQALPGVPILLMTASLPQARLQTLERCLRRRGTELRIIGGPANLEQRVRYHRQGPVDARDPLDEVRAGIKDGGKVLWVCNTVERAIAAAHRAADLQPLLYHSRFRYEDRVNRHRAVVDGFRGPGPTLAICTQVAEMSLDLSAALLVTDLAPVPSLIQRLGRLNRRAEEGDPTRPFMVVEPQTEDGTPLTLPYTSEDFTAARAWLAALGEGQLSQAALAQAWEAHDPGRRPAFVESAWLDGGPVTAVLELRDVSPGLSVLLAEDEATVRADPRRLQRYVLPMPSPPREMNWRGWNEFRGLRIAPEGMIDYHPERGARWRR